MTVTETARLAYSLGLCVVPPFEDGTKRPESPWKQWQTQRPTVTQMRTWYGERQGVGLLTGAISGNLECFEFDDRPVYESFLPLAEQSGLGSLIGRIMAGYSESTPSGGVHWLYYCETIAGNTKLARRPKTKAEKKHENDKTQVLIETRGEGGFVIIAPSGGSVHATGRPYEMLAGSLETIARVTPGEREELHRLARSFDQMPPDEQVQTRREEFKGRPGDDFNARAAWEDVLQPHGWARAWVHGGVASWRRPGKRDGISATTNHGGSDLLYVFSSSTTFEPERGYSKFSAYALLEFSGDHAAAARRLAADGYGDRRQEEQIDLGGVSIEDFATTDTGNGKWFAHLYGDRVRYDHRQGRWLVWRRHRWAEDVDGEVHRLSKEAALRRRQASAQLDEKKKADRHWDWGWRSESSARLQSCIKEASVEPPVSDPGAAWDTNPFLIGAENGVCDLGRGEMRPGAPGDRVTRTTGIVYDPEARCERWLQFLDEVSDGRADWVEFVRLSIGYSLTGSTREQVWFLCYGGGNNGKSVFLNIIRLLLGDYAANLSSDSMKRRRGNGGSGPTSDVARLSGKRLVTCPELAESSMLDEERLKAWSHGDRQTARFLNQGEFEFDMTAKFWVATNHLPQVTDASEGFWRSMMVVPFTRAFDAAERDPKLEEKLKGELPGIFAWAVAAAVEWGQRGLTRPAIVAVTTLSYREKSDVLAEFITERCTTVAGARATRGQLYASYRGWATAQGFSEKEILTLRTFGNKVDERWPNERGGKGVRWYRGIGIAAQEADEGGVTFFGPENADSKVAQLGVAHLFPSPNQVAYAGNGDERQTEPLTPHTPPQLTCDCDARHPSPDDCREEPWETRRDGSQHCMTHCPLYTR